MACSRGLAGTRVLELGSGTGAVGLFAAGLGAHVVLTDYRPPGLGSSSVLEQLRRNVAANVGLLAQPPEVLELRWGDEAQVQAACKLGPYGLLLGSDVTYRPAMDAALLQTAARLSDAGRPPPRLLLAHHCWGLAWPAAGRLGLRGRALEGLRCSARDAGWSLEEVEWDGPVAILLLTRT